jgi:hypothetical protein
LEGESCFPNFKKYDPAFQHALMIAIGKIVKCVLEFEGKIGHI